MPLPSMIAEQTRWAPTRIPGWSGRLLMFSATVFLVSIMSYFGLRYGYKPRLDKQEAEYNAKVKLQSQDISVAKQAEIIMFYSQIKNAGKLLDAHMRASRILSLLEEKTLPAIVYTSLGLVEASGEVKLTGTAKLFSDVGRQAQVFSADARMRGVTIGTISGEDATGWNFNLTLALAKGALTDSSNGSAPAAELPTQAVSPGRAATSTATSTAR